MGNDRTLAMVKPNAFMDHSPMIMNSYQQAGLIVLQWKILRFDTALAEKFYAEHQKKAFFPSLVAFMTSFCSLPMLLEGENAIAKVREINGATDPQKAHHHSIRGKLSYAFNPEKPAENFVHGSDSPESAAREIWLIFGGY